MSVRVAAAEGGSRESCSVCGIIPFPQVRLTYLLSSVSLGTRQTQNLQAAHLVALKYNKREVSHPCCGVSAASCAESSGTPSSALHHSSPHASPRSCRAKNYHGSSRVRAKAATSTQKNAA